MKKLRESLWAKALAVALLCLLALACVGSAAAVFHLEDAGAYSGSYEAAARRAVGELGQQLCYTVGSDYFGGGLGESGRFGNFRYVVTDGEGKTLASDYQGEDALWDDTVTVTAEHGFWVETRPVSDGTEAERETEYPGYPDQPQVTPTPRPNTELTEVYIVLDSTGESLEFTDMAEVLNWEREHSVRVHGYVLREMTAQDGFSQRLGLFDRLYNSRTDLLWIAGASFLLGIALFVFLLSAAGHRDGSDTVTPGVIERIPWDLLSVLLGAGVLALLYAIATAFNYQPGMLLLCALAFLAAGLLFLLWCMSTAVRLKLGTLLKSCLLYKLLRGLWRGFRTLARHLPILWKWILSLGVLAFIDLVWRMASCRDEARAFFGWALLWLLIGLVTLYAVLAFRRLRLGAKRIAAGDEGAAVDTKRLVGDFREHAEDLNHIRAGLSRALDARMKSERLKTELITNVSHDIKTPLTSIVSYVDLLGREEIENEKAREYIEVLRRQSERMKKLIEDLLEASKASTGNLPVTLADCELGVLLEQAAGEYGEKLSERGLELIVKKPDEAVTVRADSRHLWRILDNLMSNILKYAQSGTRVYLTLERRSSLAELSFRNISAVPLDVSGEELAERFVRGDASRSSEGSGLGLAIAKSLAELQGIDMGVYVDGDLFKVILRFKVS